MFEAQTKQFSLELRDVAQQNSIRCNQLSHYIEQEGVKGLEVVTRKMEKFKEVVTKLAEQFKTNLIINETHFSETSERLKELENFKTHTKREVAEMFTKEQEKNEEKITEVITSRFKSLEKRVVGYDDLVKKSEELIEKDIQILRLAMDKQRETLISKIEGLGGR